MRYLNNVTESDMAASKALEQNDPDTMRALVQAVGAVVAMRRPDHSDDVASLASVTVARLYRGDVTGAAGAAVAMATAHVTRAYALTDWDLTGDMTEAVNERDSLGDTRTTLSQWAPRPDTIADATPRDYLHTLAETVPGMRTLTDYWTAHDSDDCPDCAPGAGRRVAPRGIVAHVEGFAPTDSAYHRARRHADHALTSARPVMAALLATYAPAPAGSARQGRQVAPKSPVTTAHGDDYRAVSGREATPAESFAMRFPACRAMASHRDAETGEYGRCDCPATVRFDGEEYGAVTAPYAPATAAPFSVARPVAGTGKAVTPGTPVPSHKVTPSPRKRPGGNTGPTIPARF